VGSIEVSPNYTQWPFAGSLKKEENSEGETVIEYIGAVESRRFEPCVLVNNHFGPAFHLLMAYFRGNWHDLATLTIQFRLWCFFGLDIAEGNLGRHDLLVDNQGTIFHLGRIRCRTVNYKLFEISSRFA
jgi:hypothetical protein